MALAIQRHHLDFDIIPLNNPKTMVFVDASTYMETPSRPILQVTPPGYKKYFVANIVHNRVNTLNSNTLGFGDAYSQTSLVDLADGVWTLTYRICPYESVFVTKYHLRTVALDCLLSKVYKQLDAADCDTSTDPKIQNEIVDATLLIETGRALAQDGEASKATDYYTRAFKKVDRLYKKLTETC